MKPSARGVAPERAETGAAVGASVRVMEKLSSVGAASSSSRKERAAEGRYILPDFPPSERRLVLLNLLDLLVFLVLLPPILAVMGVAQKKRKRAAVVVAAVAIFILNVVVLFHFCKAAKIKLCCKSMCKCWMLCVTSCSMQPAFFSADWRHTQVILSSILKVLIIRRNW